LAIEILQNTNLFDLKVDAYAQGCNTKGKMGAGIAKQFHDRFPEMYADHVKFIMRQLDTDALLGSLHAWKGPEFAIFNLFTQIQLGADARLHACYDSFTDMFHYMKGWNLDSVALPAIGCGIGGLTWPNVSIALQEAYDAVGYNCEVKVAFL